MDSCRGKDQVGDSQGIVKLLLDENLSRALCLVKPGIEMIHSRDAGMAGLKNGELLAQMKAAGFSVLVTADRNLPFQQNLASAGVSVIVLDIHPNTEGNQAACSEAVQVAAISLQPGDHVTIEGPHPKRRRKQ